MSAPPRRPLVMIGLDAAELALIEAARASLPFLDRLLARADVGPLASTADVLPGSVWPTFATGRLPGEHGIYHHLQWDPSAMRIRRVSREWLPCEPFWCELERRGLDVAALDVPMTFPSRLERGVEILNWGSHDQLGPFAAAPRALGVALRRRFGARHPMGYEIPVTKTPRELARIHDNLVAGARRKGELAAWLYAQRRWDFFLTVFGETHRGGHLLWPDDGGDAGLTPLLDVYRAVDAALAPLLAAAAARDAVVLVFALHGMGPNTSQEHFVPPILDCVNAAFATRARPDADRAAAAPPARRGLVRLLRERVPARLQNAIAQAMPVAVRDAVVSRQITGGHDWARTPGLALLADLNGYLRFNVRGREAAGCLDPGGAALAAYREWLAIMAKRTCAVQMLLVAFSRRICCSRVCRESRQAGFPVTSLDTPTMRPGICRLNASAVERNAAWGPPNPSGTPNRWLEPTAISAPNSPGGRKRVKASRSVATTTRTPAVWACFTSAL